MDGFRYKATALLTKKHAGSGHSNGVQRFCDRLTWRLHFTPHIIFHTYLLSSTAYNHVTILIVCKHVMQSTDEPHRFWHLHHLFLPNTTWYDDHHHSVLSMFDVPSSAKCGIWMWLRDTYIFFARIVSARGIIFLMFNRVIHKVCNIRWFTFAGRPLVSSLRRISVWFGGDKIKWADWWDDFIRWRNVKLMQFSHSLVGSHYRFFAKVSHLLPCTQFRQIVVHVCIKVHPYSCTVWIIIEMDIWHPCERKCEWRSGIIIISLKR